MHTYYIYRDFWDEMDEDIAKNPYYHTKSGESIDISHEVPCWLYTLTKNEGTFYGAGNFCGYYGYSCFKHCKVIGETQVKYTIEEHDNDVKINFNLSIVSTQPYIRNVADTYTSPKVFKAKNDEEAFAYFEEFVLKQWDNTKEIEVDNHKEN